MLRRPPISTRTDTSFPTRRSSDLARLLPPHRIVEVEPAHAGGAGQCRRARCARQQPRHADAAAARGAQGHRADGARTRGRAGVAVRSEEHTSELQSLMRISYAVFCLTKKNKRNTIKQILKT